MAEKSFEQMIDTLDQLVKQLEAGDLPLEKSLKVYEKGVSLVSQCSQKLSDATLRVEELVMEETADDKTTAVSTDD